MVVDVPLLSEPTVIQPVSTDPDPPQIIPFVSAG